MKASELRIGNLVLLKCNNERDEIAKLLSIDEIDGCYYNNASNKKYINNKYTQINNGWCRFNIINLIPLTEEWLIRLGFEFRNTNKQYGWYLEVSKNRVLCWCHSKEISLEFDSEDYDYNNTLFDFDCEFVHQLQNLYFALTNQELTLNK